MVLETHMFMAELDIFNRKKIYIYIYCPKNMDLLKSLVNIFGI